MESLHAACVALGADGSRRGVLIRGPAGSGKSSLALLLVEAVGGALVADDRVAVERRGGALLARSHPALAGLVEVRGQGILAATELGIAWLTDTPLHLAVDLTEASERMPEPPAEAAMLGLSLPRLVLDRGVRAAGLAPLLVRAALRKRLPA